MRSGWGRGCAPRWRLGDAGEGRRHRSLRRAGGGDVLRPTDAEPSRPPVPPGERVGAGTCRWSGELTHPEGAPKGFPEHGSARTRGFVEAACVAQRGRNGAQALPEKNGQWAPTRPVTDESTGSAHPSLRASRHDHGSFTPPRSPIRGEYEAPTTPGMIRDAAGAVDERLLRALTRGRRRPRQGENPRKGAGACGCQAATNADSYRRTSSRRRWTSALRSCRRRRSSAALTARRQSSEQ